MEKPNDEPGIKPQRRLRVAFTVTVEAPLAEWMDAYAREKETSRSGVVAEALEALRELEEPGR